MSFRLLGHRLFQHGRQLVYNHCVKRNININIFDQKNRGLTRQVGLAAKVSKLHFMTTSFHPTHTVLSHNLLGVFFNLQMFT